MVNKDAYTPKLISIGPLHHGEYELHAMEMLKLRYLKEFCYRMGTRHKDIASIIEGNELKIRQCYDEIFNISSEDFVNMVVLDLIFIIELFLRSAAIDGLFRTAKCREDESDASEDISIAREHKKDCISCKPLLRKHIAQDLLLQENQLPFFIIDKLYSEFSRSEQKKYFSFLKLSHNFLFPAPKNDTVFVDKKKVKHFTDLMRYLYYPSKVFIGAEDDLIENLPNATKLEGAGVIFRKTKSGTLLDIEFKKSILIDTFPCLTCSRLLHCFPFLKYIQCLADTPTFSEVPCFEVYDETEGIFRNIMAREQCHYPPEAYICNYIVLLDYLINTRDDVDLLVDKGIIVNRIGNNKAVATMVNRLALEITAKNTCYKVRVEQIYKYCKDEGNRDMGSLRTVYFRDIWRGTATIVEII